MEIITGDLGLDLARRFRPVIEQGFESLYDLIVPITLGEFIPVPTPTVYYSVKADAQRHYLLYCFYHHQDWSASGGILGELDEHRHDFEGALIVISKLSPAGRKIVATVAHHEIHVRSCSYDPVLLEIESQGHGIHLFEGKVRTNYVRYKDYDLLDLNGDPFQKQWSTVKKHFNANKVNMPDQWNHYLIQRQFGFESDGLIYTDPARFLKLAQVGGVFKP